MPSGAECRATETDDGGATDVAYRPAADGVGTGSEPVVAEVGVPKTIRIVNDFHAGSLVINKDLTGPGAPELSDGPFVFSVVCSFDGRERVFADTVILTGDGSGRPCRLSPPPRCRRAPSAWSPRPMSVGRTPPRRR